MRRIHLDHNATTPLRPEARDALLAALDAGLGNPSSVHDAGRRARSAIDDARERVAAALGVPEDAVLFTGGGTEANNLAILGASEAAAGRIRIVTSSIEHAAVLEPVARAEARGAEVRRVAVDATGRVDLDSVGEAVRSGPHGHCAFVSLQAANNEIGSTLALGDVRRVIGDDATLHSDAVQACGRMVLDLAGDGVDLATLSAHKVGGPPGVGVLVRRTPVRLTPRVFGGAQESEMRPGTENAPAIAAAAVAIELAVAETDDYARRTRELTALLWNELRASLPGVQRNGPPLDDDTRLSNTLNVSFDAGDARTLVARLDLAGVEVSAGSACASGSIEPSHVLVALGLHGERARGGLRMSLGRTTTRADIHTAVERMRTTLGSSS